MSWFGRERVVLDECGSTNDEAEELAKQGAAHGTVVIAKSQTRGRGRKGRVWYSSDTGNVFLSCILRPPLPPPEIPPISLAAGLGVWDAVSSFGIHPFLKWPNDVLVGPRKLAGILSEMKTNGTKVSHVILGVGLNGNAKTFPGELAETATSMRLELGTSVDIAEVSDRLLLHLGHWLQRFFDHGAPALVEPWSARTRLGAQIQVTDVEHPFEGTVDGINQAGALLVTDAKGVVHELGSGSIAFVNPRGKIGLG